MTATFSGTVSRPNGIEIPYVINGPDNGRRLVFGHSLLGSGTTELEVYEPLLDAGWTVLTMDQRGHGQASPISDPAEFSLEELADDLIAILDHVGWEAAWLGGGSMGAAASLVATKRAPQRVAGLVQLAPGLVRERNAALDDFLEISAALAESMDTGVAAWTRVFTARGFDADTVAMHVERMRALDAPSLSCILATAPYWSLTDEIDALRTFGEPVVVVAWDDDPIHPMRVAREMVSAAPKGRLRRFDRTVDGTDPQALFRVLAAELAKVLGESM